MARSKKKRTSPDQRIAGWAARHDGVVSLDEALSLGLSSHQVAQRLKTGRLHRTHRKVYAVGHPELTRRGRWRAALLATGPGSLLFGPSAAAARGLSVREGSRVEVCLPCDGRRDHPGIVVHSARLEPQDRTAVNDLALTSTPRLLLDLAATQPLKAMHRIVAEAAHFGLVDAGALEDLIERSAGHRGIRHLRIATEGYRGEDGTDSVPENALLNLIRRCGLPEPAVNAPMGNYRVDFCWPAAGLIVEVDGFAAHRSRDAFERDRARRTKLTATGHEVLTFTPRQIDQNPDWVIAVMRQALARRLPASATTGQPGAVALSA